MKQKLTMLLASLFLVVGTVNADVVKYYEIGERKATLEAGDKVMFYNTCMNGTQDRTGFLVDNGSGLSLSKDKPTSLELKSDESGYIWTVEVAENNTTYYKANVKGNNGYLGIGGATNNNAAVDLFFHKWTEATFAKAGVDSENAAGETTANADITDSDNLWVVTNSAAGGTAWNGETGSFTTWSTGHPYAVYSVVEAETADLEAYLTAEKDEAVDLLTELAKLSLFSESANSAITAVENVTLADDDLKAALDQVATICQGVMEGHLAFRNSDTASSSRVNAYLAAKSSGTQGHGTLSYKSLTNWSYIVWSLEYAGAGKFYIYNEEFKKYLGNPSGNGALTANKSVVYSFEVVDGATNKIEFKCGDQTLHLNNHTDGLLSNYDSDDPASRWYVENDWSAHITNYKALCTELLNSASTLSADERLESSGDVLANLNSAIANTNDENFLVVVEAVEVLPALVAAAEDYIREANTSIITSLSTENSNHPVTVATTRSAWAVADNGTAMQTISQLGLTADETDVNQQFAIITPDGGTNHYIYSISAQRYLTSANTFTTQGEAIQFNDASSIGENKWQFQFVGKSKYINIDNQTPKKLVIDWWGTIDAGNACLITQYNTLEFDLDYALKVFNEGAEVTVKYMFEGAEIRTENELLFVGDTKTIPCTWAYTDIETITVNDEALTAPAEGSDWSFEISEAGDKEVIVTLSNDLPFALSVENDTAWHALKIRPNNNPTKWVAVSETTPYPNSTTIPTTVDGLWAFTGNPIDGIQIYNKGAEQGYTLGVDNSSNVVMLDGTTTWTLGECWEDNTLHGFLLYQGTDNRYVHDYNSTLKIWNNAGASTDPGSAFVAIGEEEMIGLAEAAKTSALETIALHEGVDYYCYPDDALATARATVEALETTDILTAMQNMTAIETALSTLTATTKIGAPAVGDYIRLKNRVKDVYMAAADDGIRQSADETSLTALWQVVDGNNDSIRLKNVSTGTYMGSIVQDALVSLVDETDAAQLSFGNYTDVYGTLHNGTGSHTFANMNEWWGTYKVLGWTEGDQASHWVFTQAYPLTVVYNYGGEELTDLGFMTYVNKGESYTIANRDEHRGKIISSCAISETAIEAVDGTWPVEVSAATTVTVTLIDDAGLDRYEGCIPEISAADITDIQSYGQYLTDLTLGTATVFSGASQPSSKDDMYRLINDNAIYVVPGQEYTMTLTFPKNQTSQALVAKVWMDVDQDVYGIYEELLATQGTAATYSDLSIITFTVPEGTTLGTTRIRLRLDGAWNVSETADGSTTRMVYDIEVIVAEEVPETTITYNIYYNGAKIATEENIATVVGAKFPIPATETKMDSKYLSFAYPEGRVGANGVYDVTVSINDEDFPIPTTITDGEFAGDTQWYLATLRSERIKYNGSTEIVTTTDKIFGDEHLFALTGNPVDGFQFYNKALGAGKAIYSNEPVNLNNNNPTPVELTTEPDGTWLVTSNSNGGFSFAVQNNSTNYYLHEKSDHLSFWESSNATTDAGSSLIFKQAYEYSFLITGVPDGEEAGATLNGSSIVNGTTIVEAEYIDKDVFGANDFSGYTWSVDVDFDAKTITLAYQEVVPEENPDAVVALVNRIGGTGTADKFKFVLDPSMNSKQETFILGSEDGKILIKGSTLSAITTGLGWYLNNVAHINISWNALNEKTVSGDAYADLSNLPVPSTEETHTSDAKYRYYLNYCTFGYSMTSWTWERWQQEIDWMALHGINMPLQIIGLEEVWRKFLTMEDENGNRKYGYDDEEAKAFVAGPAFIAWWGMNNLEGWGGTAEGTLNGGTWAGAGGVQDDAWYDRQQTLATQILERQRELGMEPVLPGFSGMVPTNFTDKTSVPTDANNGKWVSGFQRPRIIDPTYSGFADIAKDYYDCLKTVMGESQYYSMDPFHEGGSISSGKYSEAYYALYEAMEVAKSGSQWVIQQWQWSNNQKLSISAVPEGRLIVLDLFSDGSPAFDSYSGYAPQEAVFCAIPNYGGRSGLMGRLQNVTDNYFSYKAKYNSIKGVGTAPEAIEQTPVTYDLIYQLPWMNGEKPNVTNWVSNYAIARYGKDNSVVKEAWSLLRQGPLNYGADGIQGPVEDVWAARPNLNANPASAWGTTLNGAGGTYTLARRQMLIDATYKLLSQKDALALEAGSVYESNYLYDLVEFGGAVMADYAYDLLLDIKDAKEAAGANFENDEIYKARRDAFLALIADVDAFKGTNLNFRLGKWTQEARDAAGEVEGATTATPDWYEYNNARTIISTWSSPNQNLNDYSYRSWQGLMKDLYLPRWQYYFSNGCTDTNYGYFEWNWAHGLTHEVGQTAVSTTALAEGEQGHTSTYTRDPEGNTVELATTMLGKYILPVTTNDGTYYAYRYLTNDLTSEVTIIGGGTTLDLTKNFGTLTDEVAYVTGDFIEGEVTDLSAITLKTDLTEASYTGTIALTDSTKLTFAVVPNPEYYGVYKITYKGDSDADVFVGYNTDNGNGVGAAYKLIAEGTYTADSENDKLFTIVPSGSGYSISAQGLYLNAPGTRASSNYELLIFTGSKDEAGVYNFEETGTDTEIYKIYGTQSADVKYVNAWNKLVFGNDLSTKANLSTFTIEEVTTYTVTIPEDSLFAVCLPFNVVLPAGMAACDVTVQGLTSGEDGAVTTLDTIAVENQILKAGTPVLLKAAPGSYGLGITMDNTDAKTSSSESKFCGNFVKQTLQPGANGLNRYIFSDGAFTLVSAEQEIPANTCWIEAKIDAESVDVTSAQGNIVKVNDWLFKYEAATNGIKLTDAVLSGSGELDIKSQYTINGKTEKVVAISKDFLHGNTALTSVKFPASLINLGFREIEPLFTTSYEGKAGNGIVTTNSDGTTTTQGMNDSIVFPIDPATGEPYMIGKDFAWKLTLDVTIDTTKTFSFNEWGSSIVSTHPNSLADTYVGYMQIYMWKDLQNIIVKIDNGDDRYKYSTPALDEEGNETGELLVNNKFTFEMEHDGTGGYQVVIYYANGKAKMYSISASANNNVKDFDRLYYSLPEGIHVDVTFDKLISEGLFVDCTNLYEIIVDENNPAFKSCEHGVLYDKNGYYVMRIPEGETSHHFEVPSKVVKLYAGAIHGVSADIVLHSNPKIGVVTGHEEHVENAKFYLSLDDKDNTITSGEAGYGGARDFVSANANTYKKANYKRAPLEEGKYGTIMLPFAPTNAMEKYDFFALTDADTESFHFSPVEKLEPQKPYLYKLKENPGDMDMEGDTLDVFEGDAFTVLFYDKYNPTDETAGSFRALGTYVNHYIETVNYPKSAYYYYSISQAKFLKVTNKLTYRPYRAIFVVTPEEESQAPARLSLRITRNDGGTTEIAPSQIEGLEEPIYYDLMGRRVLNPLPGGIYIVNGKKVIF